MNYELIRKLLDDFEKNSLTEFQIETDGMKILMKKKSVNNVANFSNYIPKQVDDTKIDIKNTQDSYDIKAPLVGIFRTKNSNSENEFISVGRQVKKGDILFIVEAMKMLNEIISPIDGVIEKILLKDGQPVGYNETAIILRKLN